jgi:hypothetical protein
MLVEGVRFEPHACKGSLMTKVLRYAATDPAAAPGNFTSTLFDLDAAAAMLAAMTDAQRQQWQMLMTWQNSLAEWQQECWDQWVSHWGGGVPIDA